jgi:hypothetical protein
MQNSPNEFVIRVFDLDLTSISLGKKAARVSRQFQRGKIFLRRVHKLLQRGSRQYVWNINQRAHRYFITLLIHCCTANQ